MDQKSTKMAKIATTRIFPKLMSEAVCQMLCLLLLLFALFLLLNGSKDSNLKNQAISEILPNFAPIFRGGGVEIEKKWSLSIWKYISRAIQIWNQIFKIFSSCLGYWRLKNVTVKGYLHIFGPFFPFLGKMRIFPKNSVRGILYPLVPSNFMQNIKKI